MPESNEKPAPDTQADLDRPGVLTKCVVCSRPMNSPVVCDFCHSLNPPSAPTDYFELLGVPRRYDLDLDELRRKYLALNRHAHPDFHTADEQTVRDLSMRVSSMVNNAYRTLSNPVARAEYLLELLGGNSSADDKSTPDGLLAEMMLMREDAEQARSDGDDQKLAQMKAGVNERIDRITGQLSDLFARFDTTVDCEPIRVDELARIRRQLNAVSYLRRMAEQIE